MRCQIDVAFETVALVLHVQQLGRDRQRYQSAIAVRNIADCTGTGTNAAEPAHEADRGSGTTHAASVCTGDKHADDIGRALGGVDVNDLDIRVCTDALQIVCYRIAVCSRAVQQVVDIQNFFQ